MHDEEQELKEIKKITAANFTAHVKLAAHTTSVALRYLRHLGQKLGKPIEDISVDDIIASLKEADARAREWNV